MVVHELMHSIGFHHEFIRPDRNQYIWVNQSATFSWPMVAKNFEVKKSEESEVYGTDFDYGSVMMYSRYAAAGGPDDAVMVNLVSSLDYNAMYSRKTLGVRTFSETMGSRRGLRQPDRFLL